MEIAGYPVTKLDDATYAVNEFGYSTMYLLLGEKRALAVDCGVGVGDYKAVLEALTDLPYDLVATHGHVDHMGGREQFQRIFIHPDDMSQVKKITSVYRKGYCMVFSKNKGTFIRQIRPVRREPQLLPMEEHDVFDLGGRTVQVFHNPGHTLGSVSLLDVERGWLFGGDNFNPLLFLWMSHAATVKDYVENAYRVLGMDCFDEMVFSHDIRPHSKQDAWKTVHCAESILEQYGKNGAPGIGLYKQDGVAVIFKKYNVI